MEGIFCSSHNETNKNMDLEFEKLQTPNFIRCKQGTFPIGDLSREEIERYVELWKFSLLHKWEERRDK